MSNTKSLLIVIVAALVATVIPAVSDEFYLQLDATKKLYGPFSFEDGESVTIGKGEFTLMVEEAEVEVAEVAEPEVVEEIDHAADLEKRLKKIRLRRFVVAKTPISDVLQYLAIQTREKEGGDGINFVLTLSDNDAAEIEVTMSLRRKKMSDLMPLIAEQTDLAYRYEENTVVFSKPATEEDEEVDADGAEEAAQ